MKAGDLVRPQYGCHTSMTMPIRHITQARILKVFKKRSTGQEILEISVLNTDGKQPSRPDEYYIDYETETKGQKNDQSSHSWRSTTYFTQPSSVKVGSTIRVFANTFHVISSSNTASVRLSDHVSSDVMTILALS